MRFWLMRKSRLPPSLQKAEDMTGKLAATISCWPAPRIPVLLLANASAAAAPSGMRFRPVGKWIDRSAGPPKPSRNGPIPSPLDRSDSTEGRHIIPLGLASSGDHGRLAPAGTGFDPGNLPSDRDQLGESLGRRLRMTGRIRLVTLHVDSQRGTFSPCSRQPVDDP